MSKKTNYKKKVSVKLLPGEAIYVASIEVLTHIMDTYKTFGDQESDKEYKEFWYGVSNSIAEWMQSTKNKMEEFDNEEDW